jgi:hypothetical protein
MLLFQRAVSNESTFLLSESRGYRMNVNLRTGKINVVQSHRENIYYLSKFGNIFGKSVTKDFLEAAEME